MDIYIRPLREEDALISWRWRNDPEIWEFTGARPNQYITEEIEIEWARRVIADRTSKRFAICIKESGEYIGNIQLTDIAGREAQFHIFIGNKLCWGKGVATDATRLLLPYAKETLGLESIYLEVNRKNSAAIKSYKNNNFLVVGSEGDFIRMSVNL